MAQYEKLAEIYDYLVAGVDYDAWMDYMEDIIKKFDVKVTKVADLACGTGNTTIPFAKRGYQPIGIDLSSAMLAKAREKAEAEGLEIAFLEQNMCTLELPSKVDLVVCYHDGLNYVVETEDLKKVFLKVYENLNPNGLFIFDLVLVEKLNKANGDTTFVDDEEMSLIWESYYQKEKDLWQITLTGFLRQENLYEKFKETHQEKNHKREDVLDLLKAVGLKLMGEYHSYSFDAPRPDSRRVFYVAKKI